MQGLNPCVTFGDGGSSGLALSGCLSTRGNRSLERRGCLVKRAPYGVERGLVGLPHVPAGPAIENQEARPRPVRDLRVFEKAGIDVRLVAQQPRHELVDLHSDPGMARPSRPGDAEPVAQPGDDGMRIVQQIFVTQERPGQRARCAFSVQHVAQPKEVPEMSYRRVEPFEQLERRGYVPRIAERRNDHRMRFGVCDRTGPELQQPADAGICQKEDPALPELVLKQFLCALAEPRSAGRIVPARVERLPVVPGRARGCEDLIVQVCDALRYPAPALVVCVGGRHRLGGHPKPAINGRLRTGHFR